MKRFSFKNGMALILAGGRSERLFPLSLPKPLLEVRGKSLLEATLDRTSLFGEARVICNAEVAKSIRSFFRKKLKEAPAFILEPEPRDTAAAVGFALRSLTKNPPEWVGVFSADQFFVEPKKFRKFLQAVLGELNKHPEHLFLAGSSMKTKAPELHSQFGWIQSEKIVGLRSAKVKHFVEKPSGKTLQTLRRSEARINCGMFFGAYSVFEKAYSQHFPEALKGGRKFSSLPRLPIDRAIFEKFSDVRVLPMDLQWEDLGTWEMVSQFQFTQEYVSNIEKASFVLGESLKEVFVFGNEPMGVIESQGRLAIFPLAESHRMKDFLKEATKRKKT